MTIREKRNSTTTVSIFYRKTNMMTTINSDDTSQRLTQAELEEIANELASSEGLAFVLYARDDVADIAIDTLGPDLDDARCLVAELSHASPQPHLVSNKSGPPKARELSVFARVERLRASGADFILAWRCLPDHRTRIAYSPDRPWRVVRETLSDLILWWHPIA